MPSNEADPADSPTSSSYSCADGSLRSPTDQNRFPKSPLTATLKPRSDHRDAVLIPVKAFHLAKGRLSEELGQDVRARIAREMASHLVNAQRNVAVVVCCDDESVAGWAESLGAEVVWCPGTGLNGAVQQGLGAARDAGYEFVAVAHSDLPLAASLDQLLGWPGVTVVPDRHRQGSNVLSFPASIDFIFQYGDGSMQRHVAQAVRHGRGIRIVHDDALAWDIDDPADLDLPHTNFLTDLLERPS